MPETRKPDHRMFVILFFAAVYLGYCIGTLSGTEVTLENVRDLLMQALCSPLPVRITDLTGKSIAVCLLIWGVGYIYYLASVGNYMPGKEYGTSRFISASGISAKMMDRKHPRNNKILSEHLRISTAARNFNNNCLVIGGSGAGKSFYVVKPNILQCNASFVITDPKGECLRDCGGYLEAQGYRIRALNLIDFAKSDHFNPFAYIRSDNDIIRLITNFIANTTPKQSMQSDPMWERAEGLLLQALMYYEWYEAPKQGRKPSIRGVMDLKNNAKVNDDGNPSETDILLRALPEEHPARIAYENVMAGAGDTIRSVLISLNARMALLNNPEILRILDSDDMDIAALGEGVYENPARKTAIFCVIPDNDKSYNFLVGMFYTLMFQELERTADHKYHGTLPVPVAFWMDEFANVALPEDFCTVLSTMRSRNMSANIIVQNIAQLKVLFKDAWENVTGNCDTMVYLGGNEQGSHKYVSESMGKRTIGKRATGETCGEHGNSSRNYDVLGRELLDAAEVRKLDEKKCIVMIKGRDPVLDEKYRTWEKKEYLEAASLGEYVHHRTEELYREGQQQFYLEGTGKNAMENSLAYQIEESHGIFEESAVFALLSDGKDGKYMPDMPCSYYYNFKEVSPVFSAEADERVRSGNNILTKHSITGYYEDDRFVAAEPELLAAVFTRENRIAGAA